MVSNCPNSCQPSPTGDHFKVSLFEIALGHNPMDLLKLLETFKLRIQETHTHPFFTFVKRA